MVKSGGSEAVMDDGCDLGLNGGSDAPLSMDGENASRDTKKATVCSDYSDLSVAWGAIGAISSGAMSVD